METTAQISQRRHRIPQILCWFARVAAILSVAAGIAIIGWRLNDATRRRAALADTAKHPPALPPGYEHYVPIGPPVFVDQAQWRAKHLEGLLWGFGLVLAGGGMLGGLAFVRARKTAAFNPSAAYPIANAPEKRRRRRRRWSVAAVCIASFYPLASGPLYYAVCRGWVSFDSWELVYLPAWRAAQDTPTESLWRQYVISWAYYGDSHAGRGDEAEKTYATWSARGWKRPNYWSEFWR